MIFLISVGHHRAVSRWRPTSPAVAPPSARPGGRRGRPRTPAARPTARERRSTSNPASRRPATVASKSGATTATWPSAGTAASSVWIRWIWFDVALEPGDVVGDLLREPPPCANPISPQNSTVRSTSSGGTSIETWCSILPVIVASARQRAERIARRRGPVDERRGEIAEEDVAAAASAARATITAGTPPGAIGLGRAAGHRRHRPPARAPGRLGGGAHPDRRHDAQVVGERDHRPDRDRHAEPGVVGVDRGLDQVELADEPGRCRAARRGRASRSSAARRQRRARGRGPRPSGCRRRSRSRARGRRSPRRRRGSSARRPRDRRRARRRPAARRRRRRPACSRPGRSPSSRAAASASSGRARRRCRPRSRSRRAPPAPGCQLSTAGPSATSKKRTKTRRRPPWSPPP